ncbi:MAG: GNAT family N-acetyltransferase [bacterium]|nr:GNAT family N-acetyltransferase [bacterium]
MEELRYYEINGETFPLVITDSEAVLLRAKAEGRAAIGILRDASFLPVAYAAESLEAVDDAFAKEVLHRHLGLPCLITESERLQIREFWAKDWEEMEFLEQDVFAERELFESYIKTQYPFWGYGLWAVLHKESQKLIGRVGIWDGVDGVDSTSLELGYHIFTPYRRCGYGEEACRAVLDWCSKQESTKGRAFYVRVKQSNLASLALAKKVNIKIVTA